MVNQENITALRMERQHLTRKADETEYNALYRDTQPGQNVYWNGFGDPPSLTYRADFDDIEYNRKRQKDRLLIKGRFQGGNIGWIECGDLELFAGLSRKPLDKMTPMQSNLLELIEREGPLTIQQMKESTGLLVKEITPILHRFQEAFLIYEDQNEGEWDRGWYKFSEMFPDTDLEKYSRYDALKIILRRFAYRHVLFDVKMAKSFYKLPEKDIKQAVASLVEENILTEVENGYILREDYDLMQAYNAEPMKSVYAMHRNDFLVKSNEYWLKERFAHSYPDTLYYLLIDGEFHGVVAGKFRYTPPEVEDVMFDLPQKESTSRKDEVLEAVHVLCGESNPIRRYYGEIL
ncbi:MAG: hypothetical protein FWD71_15600 [Oscillospiraceae bacterium]|nr:hypothetical protein [Oscillospiraceae bacterium]